MMIFFIDVGAAWEQHGLSVKQLLKVQIQLFNNNKSVRKSLQNLKLSKMSNSSQRVQQPLSVQLNKSQSLTTKLQIILDKELIKLCMRNSPSLQEETKPGSLCHRRSHRPRLRSLHHGFITWCHLLFLSSPSRK